MLNAYIYYIVNIFSTSQLYKEFFFLKDTSFRSSYNKIKFSKSISFVNVSFFYKSSKRKVLNNVSIKILKGQNNESKPSAGLSKEKKSEVVKKAIKGGDVGKKGKGFDMIADKAAKKYGSKETGKKVAAAAMWKNVKREGVETKSWVKNLVENEYFHNFTSKNEIMELISKKLTENANPGMPKKSNLPDFLTSKAIRASAKTKQQSNEAGPATAPTKPVTKPDTKPGKPAGPYKPRIEPKQNPQAENAPVTKPKPTTKPDTKPSKPGGPYKPRIEPKQNPQAEAKKIK